MSEAQSIQMPKFGQTVEESTVVAWRKKEGDQVAKGEVLFEIETDKATLEVESFLEGTLLKILVKEGQTVPVQSVVGFIGKPGDSVPEVKAPVAAPKPAVGSAGPPKQASVPGPTGVGLSAPSAAVSAGVPAPPGRLKISPRAARLAKEKVIDPSGISGSGPGGRIVEKDVISYLASRGYDRLRITLAARNLAAAQHLDVLAIAGSRSGSRITVADVRTAMAERPKAMSKMRKVIAQRLTHSFTTTPHIFVTVSTDMTELMGLRVKLKKKGVPYTVTDFIVKAVIMSLKEFPGVNSSTDGESVRWRANVHMGVATSLEEGLVVPVVRLADDMTIAELHDRIVEVVRKAREGKLLPDEMSGSTFTISNMGMMNVENFSAIINPGESAILAVASTTSAPVVRDGKIVVRSIMKMTLSADHRIVDGAMAAGFVNAIKNRLEDIGLWKSMT